MKVIDTTDWTVIEVTKEIFDLVLDKFKIKYDMSSDENSIINQSKEVRAEILKYIKTL